MHVHSKPHARRVHYVAPICEGELLKDNLIRSLHKCIYTIGLCTPSRHESMWKGMTLQAGPWVEF